MNTSKASAALLLILVAAAALAACHSSGGGAAPAIDSFTADTNPLPAGTTETLRWVVRNADKITIDSGVGDVTGKTSVTVTPGGTTTYALTATNKDHPQGVSATVSVIIAAGPSVVYFTAVPSQVLSGAPVTLSWNVKGATTVTVDGQAVTGNSLVINPTATGTHTLSAADASGAPAVTSKAVVRVVSAPSISSFTATPSSITQGQTSVLKWAGTGRGYSIDNGVGEQGMQTQATVRPSTTTTYKLTARGPAGTSITATQQITVTPAGGTRTLSYTNPVAPPLGAVLALRQNAASTPALLVLDVIATTTVNANALAFNIAVDASKVALDSSQGGDISPGFAIDAVNGLNPGSSPAAAKASLRGDGPLANILTVGIAQKPVGNAAPADKTVFDGTKICTLRLVPIATGAPGAVIPPDFTHPDTKVLLRGASPSNKIAVGTLTLN